MSASTDWSPSTSAIICGFLCRTGGDLYKGMRTGGKILRVTVSSYTQEHQRALRHRCVSLLLPPYEEAHGRLLLRSWEKGFCLTPCVTMGCPPLMIVIVPTRHLFPNKTSIRMSRTYNSGLVLCCHGVYHLVRMLGGLW